MAKRRQSIQQPDTRPYQNQVYEISHEISSTFLQEPRKKRKRTHKQVWILKGGKDIQALEVGAMHYITSPNRPKGSPCVIRLTALSYAQCN